MAAAPTIVQWPIAPAPSTAAHPKARDARLACCIATKNCLKCHEPPVYFEACCSATLRQSPADPPLRRPSMLTAEQLLAAHKANVETLFGLTNKAFEGVEKLVELNLQVAKAAIGEAAENTKAALSAKDAQEFLAL